MALLYKFMNEESNFGMKKDNNLLEGNTSDQQFADFSALHHRSIVFDSFSL